MRIRLLNSVGAAVAIASVAIAAVLVVAIAAPTDFVGVEGDPLQ